MVSVCMATYNGEKYLEEQLVSVLQQLAPSDELIISDNQSIDNTLKIIAAFQDSRIVLLQYKDTTTSARKRTINNFENALRNAKGEYVFLCDQDDIWLPNKVKRTLEYLQTYALVLSDCSLIDETAQEIEVSYMKLIKANTSFVASIYRNPYMGCCMAFRRKVLQKALPFPQNIPIHDQWLGCLAKLEYSVKQLHEPLVAHRIHTQNASTSGSKSSYNLSQKIVFRYHLLCALMQVTLVKNSNKIN